MAWTAPRTWVAGDPLLASQLNTDVRDNALELFDRDANASLLTTGTLPSARLPSGTILQVVQGSTSTVTTNATNTYADTGVTATITPRGTASTGKVSVCVPSM